MDGEQLGEEPIVDLCELVHLSNRLALRKGVRYGPQTDGCCPAKLLLQGNLLHAGPGPQEPVLVKAK